MCAARHYEKDMLDMSSICNFRNAHIFFRQRVPHPAPANEYECWMPPIPAPMGIGNALLLSRFPAYNNPYFKGYCRPISSMMIFACVSGSLSIPSKS